jgi:hypothetical protein
MPDYLYRFRSLKRLLDDSELINQEIYFALPSTFNDPIEGYLDIFWFGDQIPWINLFKHYLLCLELTSFQIIINGEKLDIEDVPVFATLDKLPTDIYKEKVQKIFSDFFKNENIKKLIENLGTKTTKIKADELIFYLKCVHPYALSVIASNSGGVGLSIGDENAMGKIKDLLGNLESFFQSGEKSPQSSEIGFGISKSVDEQLTIINFYNNRSVIEKKNRSFILFEFHRRYVESLASLVYPPWYAACFTENIENASLWGYYGERHEGICLKFKTTKLTDQMIGIPLIGIQGISAEKGKSEIKKIMGTLNFEFKKVIYDEKCPEIDFFRSLGNITMPVFDKYWYSDGNKNFSPYLKDVFTDYEQWHKNHWKAFNESKTRKLREWEHETEWRLFFASSAIDHSKAEDRLLKYNFSDLQGIVFGIKTPLNAKLRILEIIEKKCDENKSYDFKFFQSYYSHADGKIKIIELPLLRFGPN